MFSFSLAFSFDESLFLYFSNNAFTSFYFRQITKLLFDRFSEFQYFFAVSKKLNENLCKRMSNLNHFLFQIFVQDSLQFHALKWHELKSIFIPKVCQAKSIDYIKQQIQENA